MSQSDCDAEPTELVNKRRVKNLVKTLKSASEAYYNTDKPIMTDEEFDENLKRLIELDEENDFLKTIGIKPSESSPLSKVNHEIPMTSLNNINNSEELSKWIRNLPKFGGEIVLQPKLDGASIELIYKKGVFSQAITRGDGFIGEDITHTIKKAQGFPLTIKKNIDVSIRCEAVITAKDWEANFKDEKDASNPRNTVCGLIRRLDSKNAEFITCVAFDVIIKENDFHEFEIDKVYWLKTNGFEHPKTEWVENCYQIKDVEEKIERFNTNRINLPYETDGVVIKIDAKIAQNQAGIRDNRPKWAVAYKFLPSEAISTVLEINLSIGPTGTITPVAEISPAKIGGTTITNVSLCNFDEIKRLNVGVGDKVTVVRSGDVIPKITRVVEKYEHENEFIVSLCPSCGSKIVKDGVYIKCGKPQHCEEVQFRKVLNWIEKRNIMFLGESNLSKLISDDSSFPNIPMLYRIDFDNIVNSGVGKGMAKKIFEEINKSRKTSLEDFLGSLALPLLGKREVKNLINLGIDSVEKFLNLKESDIIDFEGFQETKAKKIVRGIQENKGLITTLNKYLTIIQEKKELVSKKLNCLTICFTGKSSLSRKELEGLVVRNGGIVKDHVGKDLDILVIADVNSISSKAVNARKFGIRLMSEEDFLKMIGD